MRNALRFVLPSLAVLAVVALSQPLLSSSAAANGPYASVLSNLPPGDAAAAKCGNKACINLGDRLACTANPLTNCKLGQRRPATGPECFQTNC